jgi:hypothetical protein
LSKRQSSKNRRSSKNKRSLNGGYSPFSQPIPNLNQIPKIPFPLTGGYSPFSQPIPNLNQIPKIPFPLTGGYSSLSLPTSPYTRQYVKSLVGGNIEQDEKLVKQIQTVIGELKTKLNDLCGESPL